LNRTRHEQLAELFDRLVELEPAQRTRELERLEPSLRAELESLLVADAQTRDPVAAAIAPQLPDALQLQAGTLLGDYRVLRELGAGGMGTVLLAERADGRYQQRVAIKLIRGFPTADGQRRLRQERQILAALDHPNIAHLLDGGETVDGQPFVVMEYVEGLGLLEHVASAGLDLSARLDLFERIAQAVQHAHQRLVIHRDLKPANVLVRSDGQPKLLDFGVAKLTDMSAASDPRQTSTRVWTPGYASPEQERGEAVTTATDVYGLGVLLRELLSGERSLGQRGVLPAGFEPLALDAELRGLLDMATAEHSAQRYPTVQALLDDIGRYRSGRPLRAAADTPLYRLRKFLRRHRAGAMLTVLALVMASLFVWRLALERDRAVLAERDAEQARAQAELEAEAARAALDFLADALAALAPEAALSMQVSVRDLLDRAQAQLAERSGDDVRVRRTIQRRLGHLYYAIGEPTVAEAMFAAGLESVVPTRRSEALALATDLQGYATALGVLDRGRDSLAAAEAAQALRERFAPDDPVERLRSLEGLGFARYRLGELDAADALWSEALALAADLPEPPVDSVVNIYQVQGGMLDFRGEYARALALADAGWAFAEQHLPAESPARVNLLRVRAEALMHLGDPAAAEASMRQAIALQRRIVGERGSRLGMLYNGLGLILNELGRYREAIEALQQGQALHAAVGSIAMEDAISLANLAAVHENAGDYAVALQLFDTALQRADEGEREADDLARRMLERARARCLALSGQTSAALETLADLQRRALELDGDDSFEYAMLAWQSTVALRRAGDVDAGRQQLVLARRLFAALAPDAHPVFAHMLRAQAEFDRIQGRLGEAEVAQREAVSRLHAAAVLPLDLAIARAELAGILAGAGRMQEARDELEPALPVLRDSLLTEEISRAAAETLALRLSLR